mmetsp:Transcript_74288/g.120654  ORF Transcript_74288/g.120654 Transcript_74288/m.120654 type:complete len:211 (-) Transcript_74288:370-1002(-)
MAIKDFLLKLYFLISKKTALCTERMLFLPTLKPTTRRVLLSKVNPNISVKDFRCILRSRRSIIQRPKCACKRFSHILFFQLMKHRCFSYSSLMHLEMRNILVTWHIGSINSTFSIGSVNFISRHESKHERTTRISTLTATLCPSFTIAFNLEHKSFQWVHDMYSNNLSVRPNTTLAIRFLRHRMLEHHLIHSSQAARKKDRLRRLISAFK